MNLRVRSVTSAMVAALSVQMCVEALIHNGYRSCAGGRMSEDSSLQYQYHRRSIFDELVCVRV